jgi:type IV pilus assembly protein PilM
MIFGKPSAFGLDLSDLSIKLALLEKTGREIKLVSFSRQEIPEAVIESGVIKKENELIEIIKKTISQAKGRKVKTKYCVVSLPETESYIRVVQLPKLKEEEIAEAIKWEVEANIPMSVNDIYFDWQVIETGFNQLKDHLDILIGALPKALVDPYLEVIKKSGLRPVVFEIESIATARSLIKQDSLAKPTMIIDLGAKRTSFIFFANGMVLFTTSLPISNNLLIDDIAKALKISYAKAKSLKFKIGLDLSKDKEGKIFRAVEPRLSELVEEIKKYLDYYHQNLSAKYYSDSRIARILLCGGGANLKGLSGFLSSRLKIEVAVGNPWVNIMGPDVKRLPDLPFSESLAFATALGLALRGLD